MYLTDIYLEIECCFREVRVPGKMVELFSISRVVWVSETNREKAVI